MSYRLGYGSQNPERYWQLDFAAAETDPARDYQAEFRDLFLAAVEKRLVAADVPVGVLLWGGSFQCGRRRRGRAWPQGFSHILGRLCRRRRYDETLFARRCRISARTTAKSYRPRKFLVFCRSSSASATSRSPTWHACRCILCCRLARRTSRSCCPAKAATMLAGYNFDSLGRVLSAFGHERGRRRLARALAAAVGWGRGDWLRLWAEHGVQDMLGAKPYHMTQTGTRLRKLSLAGAWKLCIDRRRLRERYVVACRHPIDQVQQVYCGDWLTEDLLMKADKMSMATSLEVREPFLDHALAEWAAGSACLADRKRRYRLCVETHSARLLPSPTPPASWIGQNGDFRYLPMAGLKEN